MNKFYPDIKMQKPGYDFYSYTIITQVLICFYIILLFPRLSTNPAKQSGENNIFTAVNNDQISGNMLLVLVLIVILIIVDRVIYKTHKFKTPESAMSME